MNLNGTSSETESADPRRQQEETETAIQFIRAGAEKLRALNISTERDFLSVGANLQHLSLQSAASAKAAGSIVDLITGEGVEKDTERLSEVVGLVDEYFRESGIKFQHDSGSLVRMLGVLETAYRPLSVFKSIVKHLHMLGVSTRIENARLTNDGNFQVLAEHVEKLSVVIASKSEGILKGLTFLHEAVKQTLAKVLVGKEAVNDRTQEILDAAANGLSTLCEKRRLSSQAAVRLAARSEHVSAEMSDVISSLQFHDITRQQIEHVIEVFDELTALEQSQGNGDRGIIMALGEVGSLQIDQLDHAKKEMLSAVGKIMDGLHGMARNLSGIVKETESLIGVAGEEHSSFLSDLNHSVSFVIGALGQNAETDRELSGSVRYVSGLIENLSAFVNDIEEIASEIELIAINAQIRAARTAGNGGALGVLAEAIRKLSDSTRNQTLEMTGTLKGVRDAAMALGTADGDNGNAREIGAITTEMQSLFDSLGRSQERLSSLLAELKRETGSLTGAIETMVTGMSAHTRTDEVVSGVIHGLRQLGAGRKRAARAEADKDTERLRALASRYTMHQERYVHEAHMGRVAGTMVRAQEKGFADNVELF
jgi:methyl-accepting chemotaxis protein